MVENVDDDWVELKKKQIKEIRELEPRDRLDLVKAMAMMNQYIISSCQGWAQWVFNPAVISRFEEKDLREFYERFKSFTLDFLNFDIVATEKLKPPPRKPEKRPPTYA